MTKEELEAIKERLDRANEAERRVQYLQESIDKVKAKSLVSISIPIESGELQYCDGLRQDGTPNWRSVCWRGAEEGLAEELHAAVVDVLSKRLAEATKAFQEV